MDITTVASRTCAGTSEPATTMEIGHDGALDASFAARTEGTFYFQKGGIYDSGRMATGGLPDNVDVSQFATRTRRLSDVLISSALLLLTLPMVIITALLIKFDSPGPVIYRQLRSGLREEPFVLLKFRSMSANAEAEAGPVWARHRDPRVTRVGRFLRLARIDELPQLVNVLRGEMSMIGPRPERPHFVDKLSLVLPNYLQRVAIRPGITGLAQVSRPYAASVEDSREKLAYDLYYLRHRTIRLDLWILFATVKVVLLRAGGR